MPEDPSSLASLRERAGDLDYVGLHWAAMREDATVEVKSSPEVISLVRALGARPVLSVTSGAGADVGHAVVSSPESRTKAVASLVAAAGPYDGVSIDFEGLYSEDREGLTRFVAELAGSLRPLGKQVSMALSAKTSDTITGWAGALDYAALAPHADLFILMGYGYRTARSSTPGSVAPMPWVEAALAFAASQIPPGRILLGVPLYGYDWNTASGSPARALRHPETVALASQFGVQTYYDPVQRSAHLSYTKEGQTHEVWFEDSVSVDARLALVQRYGLAGVAAWRLGHEDPKVWPAINGRLSLPTPGFPSQRTWYFAEGSTAPPFETWILLQNPGPVPANARLTFMLEGGGAVVRDVAVGSTSRVSIFANQVLPNSAFSTRVDSDQPIYVERAMYVGFDGHVVTGVAAPSTTWYLAEGSTGAPFHTWILVQNPSGRAGIARLTYLRENGSRQEQELFLPSNSRTSVFANQVIPDSAFSTRVESSVPVIVERAMYRFPGNEATGVTGVTAPSRSWFFAAGQPTFRNQPVDTWLLLQNPGKSAAIARVTFFGPDGQTATMERYLPPESRQSVYANQFAPQSAFGIKVEASEEVIAERSVFIAPSQLSGNQPQGAHGTQGATALASTWVLPEGSSAPPFSTRISVLNPHAISMGVRFDLMREGGQVVSYDTTIQPSRVFTLETENLVRSAGFSARVATSLPSAVERTMVWAKQGKTGLHNTLGIPAE